MTFCLRSEKCSKAKWGALQHNCFPFSPFKCELIFSVRLCNLSLSGKKKMSIVTVAEKLGTQHQSKAHGFAKPQYFAKKGHTRLQQLVVRCYYHYNYDYVALRVMRPILRAKTGGFTDFLNRINFVREMSASWIQNDSGALIVLAKSSYLIVIWRKNVRQAGRHWVCVVVANVMIWLYNVHQKCMSVNTIYRP